MSPLTTLAPLVGPGLGSELLARARPVVDAGAVEDAVISWLIALRDVLATEEWTDVDGVTRSFPEAALAKTAAGNCTGANGDLASHLVARGFEMGLTDLSRAHFENHTVAQVRFDTVSVFADVAYAQFGVAPWPFVVPSGDYLARTGFRVVFEEPVPRRSPGARRSSSSTLTVRSGTA